MKDRNNIKTEYKKINTKDLFVDDFYQRDIDPKRISRMVKNYDPCLVNVIKVSFRDSKYWIFDGQHTTILEKTVRGNGGDVFVECKVFYGLTRADETELFIAQNGDAVPPKQAQKLKGLYNSGDADVVGMVNDTAKAGVIIDPKFTPSIGKSKIIAYSTIKRIYMRFKQENKINNYIDMLHVINTAWNGSSDGFVREILNGMAKFFKVYAGKFKLCDLIKSLQKVSPVSIVREGKSFITGSTTDAGYARVILQVYNKNRTTNRLEDNL